MTLTTEAQEQHQSTPRLPFRPAPWLIDVAVILAYLAGAVYVSSRLWLDLTGAVTSSNEIDYTFFQYVLSHAAHAVTNFENPLFNSQMNAPFGVNMMANTSMLGLSVPLIPVTLLFGPKTSFAVVLVIAFAGTAAAWYYFFRRHITDRRLTAFAAGLFCGFAPGIVSQGNGHPNIAAQFVIPFIISRVIQIRQEPQRAVRHGVILGLLMVYQMFINEEVLLYTALACAVIAATYLLSHRDQARSLMRPYLTGLGTAAGVALALMAYPLWFQFFGPQHYRGPFEWAHEYGIDIAAYPSYATESIGNRSRVTTTLAQNPAEENAFYGWPLCLLGIVCGVALWRVMAARLAAVTGAVLVLLSLGNHLKVYGHATGIPMPWRLVGELPLIDSIIVTRLALGVGVALAIIVAIATDRVLDRVNAAEPKRRPKWRALTAATLAIAFVPLAPTPLPTSKTPPAPAFFSNGTWRQYVTDGVVLPVPPDIFHRDAMNWLVATKLDMRIADGYFLGPTDEHNDHANYGGPKLATWWMLFDVAYGKPAPAMTEELRRRTLADLRTWQVDALVLGPRANHEALRQLVEAITGRQPVLVDGVLVWDVRDLV